MIGPWDTNYTVQKNEDLTLPNFKDVFADEILENKENKV